MTPATRRRPGGHAARALRTRCGVIAATTVLAVSNVVSNRLWPRAYLPWNVTVATGLLALALRCGLSWSDLGLTRSRLRRGLLAGGAAAGSVAALYLAAFTMPATRGMFVDERATGPLSKALFAAFVRIPLGTVLLEELAFRGVLPGLVGGPWWRRTVISSALFGLWHVLPSLEMTKVDTGVGAMTGRWGPVGHATLAVLATFAAGVALSAHRRWGGHLAAPMLAHLATNSLGVLLAWGTGRAQRR